ncbi:hypothetical protein Pelo_1538 [Pelomyxa schiedti]|nr:hypothetical protein Pelo_1538 [Pelomyxa schiedti]
MYPLLFTKRVLHAICKKIVHKSCVDDNEPCSQTKEVITDVDILAAVQSGSASVANALFSQVEFQRDVLAAASYSPPTDIELTIHENEVLTACGDPDGFWVWCINASGKEGWVDVDYIKELNSPSQPPHQPQQESQPHQSEPTPQTSTKAHATPSTAPQPPPLLHQPAFLAIPPLHSPQQQSHNTTNDEPSKSTGGASSAAPPPLPPRS